APSAPAALGGRVLERAPRALLRAARRERADRAAARVPGRRLVALGCYTKVARVASAPSRLRGRSAAPKLDPRLAPAHSQKHGAQLAKAGKWPQFAGTGRKWSTA